MSGAAASRPPSAAGLRLEVVAGKAVGMSILVEDELVIGRHAVGAGRLADDEEISRMHARVTADARGVCAVEDMGSTNGTFVNGLRISAPQVLSVGDTIELGQTTLAVRELPQVTPEEAASPAAAMQPTVVPRAKPTPPEAGIPTPAAISDASPAVGEQTPDADRGAPATQDAATSSVGAEEETAALPPPLSLQLEVDFVAREARIFLEEGADPVRLVFEAGAWRSASAPPSEKGGPA